MWRTLVCCFIQIRETGFSFRVLHSEKLETGSSLNSILNCVAWSLVFSCPLFFFEIIKGVYTIT